jgi:hypothetical protein
MPFSIAHLPSFDKLCQQVEVVPLEQIYPREVVSELLSEQQAWEQRERKLTHLLMVYVVILLCLLPRHSLQALYEHVTRAYRWLRASGAHEKPPTEAALCYRRGTLGLGVLRRLAQRVCRPLATAETPGAFAFGRRLMAIDSTLEDVPDTQANAAFFGRVASGASASPFPQARCLYLAEAGTHALVNALCAPCRVSEHRLFKGLLRSISAEMLVLLDRGLFSGAICEALRARGAHALARLEAGMLTKPLRFLPDGSYLVQLTPATCQGLQAPLTLRVIEYHLEPQTAQRLGQLAQSRNSRPSDPTALHRLVTTLLDPQEASATDLLVLYHERWEVELTIDETRTHQRLAARPLRSQTPLGVLQELYGLQLAHYAVRSLMATSAAQAHLDPDRLSFTHAIHVLHDALPLLALVPPPTRPLVFQHVLAELRLPSTLLPPRRLRFNPRVLKRSQTKFRRKRPQDQGFHLKHRSFADILLI